MPRYVFGWWMTLGALAWLALFSHTEVAARLNGLVWPVVTPLVVSSAEPVKIDGIDGTRLRGAATIKRKGCDFRGVDWDLTDGDNNARVIAYFADEAELRGDGVQQWEALMIGVPPERIGETVGRVQHKCGAFPVETPFFNAESLVEGAIQ